MGIVEEWRKNLVSKVYEHLGQGHHCSPPRKKKDHDLPMERGNIQDRRNPLQTVQRTLERAAHAQGHNFYCPESTRVAQRRSHRVQVLQRLQHSRSETVHCWQKKEQADDTAKEHLQPKSREKQLQKDP